MEKEKKYDENQQKAIDARDGYYLVLAPPGCGKTDILAERIARARSQGVELEQMLCLTFTNRASRGMRNRIVQRLANDSPHPGRTAAVHTQQSSGDRSIASLFVGNIHRYCSKYLFENAVVAANTSIIDDDDQADLLMTYDIDMFWLKNNQSVNKAAVKYVVELASYIHQSILGQPESVKYGDPTYPDLYRIARECGFSIDDIPAERQALRYALQYIEYKKARNIIDFLDILVLAYQHMATTPDHRRYTWIQVDEVQDLNFLQMAIIDQLTAPDPTVMYLGDEQQAIFSFMGAKLSLLTMLKDRCRDHLLTLGNNYRSPQYLIDICNDYAEHELGVDRRLLPKSQNHTPKERFDIVLTESNDVLAEGRRVLRMVNHYLGLNAEDRLAILVTKNDEADAISATLTRAGIANFKISGTDMFKSKSYKTLSSLYCVLSNDFNFEAWSRLIYGIKGLPTLVGARNLVTRLKHLMMTPSDLMRQETYLQRFAREYSAREFVFFDTETTGLNVLEDDIVQIAAFKVRGGRKVEGSDFDILLHTDRQIPPMLGDNANPLVERYASHPHHTREEGLQMFIDYIGDCPLLGHNVTYDYLILQNNAQRTLGRQVEYDTYDSLHIIKCVEPNMRRYRLETLIEELGLAGRNSHLANEDIEATKSLVDYCVWRIAPVLKAQADFLQEPRVRQVASHMRKLAPQIQAIKEYLHKPVSATHRNIADELGYMHDKMVELGYIKNLGPKYDVFLRFVRSEWVDESLYESLYDQISSHIYDITASINEGDLVNSKDLLQDRVFIMTVYKGKGLEFENVVVLGAINGNYPFFKVNKTLSDPESTEEERRQARIDYKEDARKFYVAISRAKKRLCVSYTAFNSRDYPARITPFMSSIKHHFLYFHG